MKLFKKSIIAMLATGVLLFSCAPDKVAPAENSTSAAPSIANAAGDPHPRLDKICGAQDSIVLASEHDGSLTVSKCNIPGGMGPCNTTTAWGGVELYSGFDYVDSIFDNGDDVEYFVANFWTNGGFYIDQSQSDFGVASSFNFNNGIPIVDQDWFSNPVNPLVNKLQDRRRVDEMGVRNFSVALRLTVVKLNLYSQVVAGSATTLWGYNPDWNNASSDNYSPTSAYLTPFEAINCAAPVIPVDTVCEVVYEGIPCNNGCTDLTPNVSGATGTLSYAWSTGETTASINVCPTADTPYSVTVSEDGTAYKSTVFNVNVWDVSCEIRRNRGGNSCGGGGGVQIIPGVKICHVPPGNPSARRTRCVRYNRINRHVTGYCSPGQGGGGNSCGGHTGDQIGECGANPCL